MRCERPWTLPILFCGLACAVARAQELPTAKALWKTDLRELGLADHLETSRTKALFSLSPKRTVPLITGDSIAFARGNRIAVVFLTQEVGDKNIDVEASRKLHAISLDAVSGKVIATRTWPAPDATNANVYVKATKDGDFVLSKDHGISIYSAGLQQVTTLNVGIDPGAVHGWSLLVPPNGDLIFLQRYLDHSVKLRMFNAQNLHETRSWDDTPGIMSASGKNFAAWRAHKGLYVRGLDTPWHLLIGETPCLESWGAFRTVKFANEDYVLVTECDSVQVIGVDGRTLFVKQFPKGHPISDASASPDGRFVAVAVERMHGITIEVLDMYRSPVPWRILIYDIKNGRLVAAIRFGWRLGGCVFSPDSSALALLSDGIVELFSLPRSSRNTSP